MGLADISRCVDLIPYMLKYNLATCWMYSKYML